MADSPIHTPFLAQLATLTNSNYSTGKYYVRNFFLMWFLLKLVLGIEPSSTLLLNFSSMM
jgi:hypothetical protein